jgi:hypothetical protein
MHKPNQHSDKQTPSLNQETVANKPTIQKNLYPQVLQSKKNYKPKVFKVKQQDNDQKDDDCQKPTAPDLLFPEKTKNLYSINTTGDKLENLYPQFLPQQDDLLNLPKFQNIEKIEKNLINTKIPYKIDPIFPDWCEKLLIELIKYLENCKAQVTGTKKIDEVVKISFIRATVNNIKKRLKFEKLDSIDNEKIISKIEKIIGNEKKKVNRKQWAIILSEAKKLLKKIRPLDIQETLRLIKETKQFGEDISGQEILILLGETGVGKSTTILHLAGAKLVPDKKRYTFSGMRKNIRKPKGIEKIRPGHGGWSKTKHVIAIQVDLQQLNNNLNGKLFICDTPGFGDTAGPEVNIANSVGLQKALNKCKNARILMLISDRSIGSRSKGLREFVLRLGAMFSNLVTDEDNLKNNFAYLFTQTSLSEEDLCEDIKNALDVLKGKKENNTKTLTAIQLLKQMQQQLEDDARDSIINLKEHPKELLQNLLNHNPISFSKKGVEINFALDKDTNAILNNQLTLYKKSINQAINNEKYHLVLYKLNELKELYNLTKKEGVNDSYKKNIKNISERLNEISDNVINDFNISLQNYKESSLIVNKILSYKQIKRQIEYAKSFLSTHNISVDIKKFNDNLFKQAKQLLHKSNTLLKSQKIETIDVPLVKGYLNKILILNFHFNIKEIISNYRTICFSLSEKINNLLPPIVKINEEYATKLDKAIYILNLFKQHLNNEVKQHYQRRYKQFKNKIKENLKPIAVEKQLQLENNYKKFNYNLTQYMQEANKLIQNAVESIKNRAKGISIKALQSGNIKDIQELKSLVQALNDLKARFKKSELEECYKDICMPILKQLFKCMDKMKQTICNNKLEKVLKIYENLKDLIKKDSPLFCKRYTFTINNNKKQCSIKEVSKKLKKNLKDYVVNTLNKLEKSCKIISSYYFRDTYKPQDLDKCADHIQYMLEELGQIDSMNKHKSNEHILKYAMKYLRRDKINLINKVNSILCETIGSLSYKASYKVKHLEIKERNKFNITLEKIKKIHDFIPTCFEVEKIKKFISSPEVTKNRQQIKNTIDRKTAKLITLMDTWLSSSKNKDRYLREDMDSYMKIKAIIELTNDLAKVDSSIISVKNNNFEIIKTRIDKFAKMIPQIIAKFNKKIKIENAKDWEKLIETLGIIINHVTNLEECRDQLIKKEYFGEAFNKRKQAIEETILSVQKLVVTHYVDICIIKTRKFIDGKILNLSSQPDWVFIKRSDKYKNEFISIINNAVILKCNKKAILDKLDEFKHNEFIKNSRFLIGKNIDEIMQNSEKFVFNFIKNYLTKRKLFDFKIETDLQDIVNIQNKDINDIQEFKDRNQIRLRVLDIISGILKDETIRYEISDSIKKKFMQLKNQLYDMINNKERRINRLIVIVAKKLFASKTNSKSILQKLFEQNKNKDFGIKLLGNVCNLFENFIQKYENDVDKNLACRRKMSTIIRLIKELYKKHYKKKIEINKIDGIDKKYLDKQFLNENRKIIKILNKSSGTLNQAITERDFSTIKALIEGLRHQKNNSDEAKKIILSTVKDRLKKWILEKQATMVKSLTSENYSIFFKLTNKLYKCLNDLNYLNDLGKNKTFFNKSTAGILKIGFKNIRKHLLEIINSSREDLSKNNTVMHALLKDRVLYKKVTFLIHKGLDSVIKMHFNDFLKLLSKNKDNCTLYLKQKDIAKLKISINELRNNYEAMRLSFSVAGKYDFLKKSAITFKDYHYKKSLVAIENEIKEIINNVNFVKIHKNSKSQNKFYDVNSDIRFLLLAHTIDKDLIKIKKLSQDGIEKAIQTLKLLVENTKIDIEHDKIKILEWNCGIFSKNYECWDDFKNWVNSDVCDKKIKLFIKNKKLLGSISFANINNILERARDEIITQIRSTKCDIKKIADFLSKMKLISDKISHCKKLANSLIDECINYYQKDKKNIIILGSALSENLYGNKLKDEKKCFEVYKRIVLERQIKGRNYLQYVLDNIDKKQGGISKQEKSILKINYEDYERTYNKLCKKYMPDTDTNTIAKLAKEIAQTKTNNTKWDKEYKKLAVQLIAHVFAIWSLNDVVQDVSGKKMPLTPFVTQVIAIFRILGIDELHDNNRLTNNLVQILTGEGKSIVFAVTASVLALLGFDVDCVCYSKYLSQRDYQAFKHIFVTLGIQSHISYGSFNELCEKQIINRVGDIRTKVEQMITTGQYNIVNKNKKPNNRPKVLLIDEVDVFFREDFYGKLYNPIIKLKGEKIKKLTDLIWKKRKDSQFDITELVNTDEYKDCCNEFKDYKYLIIKAATQMLRDVKIYNKRPYDVQDNKIVYKEHDSVSSKVVYGYETLFAYYYEHEKGTINTVNLEEYIGINVDCGKYAYDRIPGTYDHKIGITGTLEYLNKEEKNTLREEYKFAKYTYIPTIFDKNMALFNMIPSLILSSNKTFHFKDIEAEIRKQLTHYQGEKTLEQRAVLVFFENEQLLNEFYQKHLDYEKSQGNVLILKENLTNKEKKRLISLATESGKICLCTKPFGRGTDFVCNDPIVLKNGGVHVIQTFFSDNIAEEKQIIGRTGRRDKSGSCSIIINKEDIIANKENEKNIKKRFFVTKKEWQEIISMQEKNNKYKLLDSKRKKLFTVKYKKLKELAKKCGQQHEKTLQFSRDILKKNTNAVRNFIRLHNKSSLFRTIWLMDATYSMSVLFDKCKEVVKKVFKRIYAVLEKRKIQITLGMQFALYRNYNSNKNEILETSKWVYKPDKLCTFINGVKAMSGWINEAVEIGLWHVNEEAKKNNISQVVLIGDMPPNTEGDVKWKRNDKKNSGEKDWSLTRFKKVTYFKPEVEKLKSKNIPVHTLYIERAVLYLASKPLENLRAHELLFYHTEDKTEWYICDVYNTIKVNEIIENHLNKLTEAKTPDEKGMYELDKQKEFNLRQLLRENKIYQHYLNPAKKVFGEISKETNGTSKQLDIYSPQGIEQLTELVAKPTLRQVGDDYGSGIGDKLVQDYNKFYIL